ncbi:MAG: hypothetical protein M3Y87_28095 [Myxococcota bacterium]|nr:hypothetical protein [Myxococcota bacterium]
MTATHVTMWSTALATFLVSATVRAQEVPIAPLGHGPGSAFEDTMSTGLVPLFTAMGAGIAFMLLLAIFASLIMRPRMPRLGT